MIMQKTCKNEPCKRKFDKTSLSDLCQACSAAFRSGETLTQGSNDQLVKKIRELEAENSTIKTRLKALGNWALKVNESVGHEAFNRGKMVTSSESKLRSDRKCKVCKETFLKNCELENHMVNVHASEKTHA